MKYLSLCFLICFPLLSANAQSYNFKLDKKLTIGKEISQNTEYLFGRIKHIVSGESGNIYVVDAADRAIRIFDNSGSFIRKVGERGRGPGEFREITHFGIGRNNELYVLDRFQSRVSFFDTAGNLTETLTLHENTQLTAQFIFESTINTGFFLSYNNFADPEYIGKYLHLYDSELDEVNDSFINIFNYFFEKNNDFENALSKPPKYFATRFGSHKIALTSNMYSGIIAVLDEESLSETKIGVPIDNRYELLDWNKRNQYRNSDEVGFGSISGTEGKYFYQLTGKTFGLVGNKNFLLHFYGLFKGTEIIPYLNIYDSTGKLIRSQKLNIEGLDFIKEGVFSVAPKFLDDNNTLYLSDYYYENKYPAVLVFDTNLDDLSID